MARPLRILIPDGCYHVFGRGWNRCAIFSDDQNRKHFLKRLGGLCKIYRFVIHSYMLMDNHHHLILQTPEANSHRHHALRSPYPCCAVAGREEGLQAKRALRWLTTPGEVRAIVEELRGESWQQFSRRRGDWARPLFLWGVWKRCGLTLRETGEAAGGMKPAAVDAAVKQLEKRSSADRALRSAIRKLINRIDSANIEN